MARNFKKIRWGKVSRANLAIALAILILTGWLAAAFPLDRRGMFLPGITSEGHVLIEVSCNSCHEGFKPVTNDTCMRCHEAELAEDFHPPKKFRDPRWIEKLEAVDATKCTACHQEHVHMTGRGVHLPADVCMTCHQGIIEGDLASHDGFTPDGCWTAGCHNFHDHRGIATGFIRQNLDQPPVLPDPVLPDRGIAVKAGAPPAPDLSSEFPGGRS